MTAVAAFWILSEGAAAKMEDKGSADFPSTTFRSVASRAAAPSSRGFAGGAAGFTGSATFRAVNLRTAVAPKATKPSFAVATPSQLMEGAAAQAMPLRRSYLNVAVAPSSAQAARTQVVPAASGAATTTASDLRGAGARKALTGAPVRASHQRSARPAATKSQRSVACVFCFCELFVCVCDSRAGGVSHVT